MAAMTLQARATCTGLVMVLCLAGCATTTPPIAQRGSSPTLTGSELLAAHRIEKVRSYEHEVKLPDGSEQWQRVEWGWDYTDAVAYELITDLNGKELGFSQVPGVTLRPTDREMDRAVALVRADPQLAPTAATPGALFEGGFVLMEPDHAVCHLHSRCLYVLASTNNGRNKILQAIVDLQTEQVVDPNFDPSMIGSQ